MTSQSLALWEVDFQPVWGFMSGESLPKGLHCGSCLCCLPLEDHQHAQGYKGYLNMQDVVRQDVNIAEVNWC